MWDSRWHADITYRVHEMIRIYLLDWPRLEGAALWYQQTYVELEKCATIVREARQATGSRFRSRWSDLLGLLKRQDLL